MVDSWRFSEGVAKVGLYIICVVALVWVIAGCGLAGMTVANGLAMPTVGLYGGCE